MVAAARPATLSDEELARAAYAAGFRGEALTTAVAVALAESGGRPSAIGDQSLANQTWGPSVGLWQIRSLNAQRGTGGARDLTRLPDPLFNARAAFEISSGGRNWSPWSAFTRGRHRSFSDRARAAVASLTGSGARSFGPSDLPVVPGGPTVGDVFPSAGDVVEGVFNAARPFVLYAAVVGLGFVLLAAGAWRSTERARAGAGQVAAAVPVPQAQAAAAVL